MSSAGEDDVGLIGCSVRGPGHIEDDIPNQDSWSGTVVSNERVVIVVGDGMGSADLSHKGSDIATREACRSLQEYLDSTEAIREESVDQAFREAFDQARSAVRDKAEELDESISEFDTTLLAVVAGPSGIAGAAVGDGGIVIENGETYDLLVPREMNVVDLPAAHFTHSVVDDDWGSYRYGYSENCSGVVVFSDGIEEFVWDGPDSVRPALFDGFFKIARKIQEHDRAKEKLEELLTGDKLSKFSDDKTVAVGDFPANFEQEDETADGECVPSENQVDEREVETTDGERVPIGDQIERDVDSCTYRIEDAESDAAKLYDQPEIDENRTRDKIQRMIDSPPDLPKESGVAASFAWPTDILTNAESGEFLGYRMSRPPLDNPKHVLDFTEEYPHTESGSSEGLLDSILKGIGIGRDTESGGDPYDVSLALAEGVHALHQAGHAIGDFHHSKILIDDNRVMFVDCDGFHISGESVKYDGSDIAPEYAPPMDSEASEEVIQQGDRFALAVHIFRLLMEGYHPFETDEEGPTEELEAMIQKSPFPYRVPDSEYLRAPEDAPPYDDLPPEIRNLFEICFIEGQQIPEMRPTAGDWAQVLS